MTATTVLPLSVTIATRSPDAARHRLVLASLPNRLREVAGSADVAMVSGLDADTDTTIELIEAGVRAVVVGSPAAFSLDDLRAVGQAAERTGALVAPALRFLPRLVHDTVTFGSAEGTRPALIESVITARRHDPIEAVVEQLAVVRYIAGEVTAIRTCQCVASHYILNGTAGSDGSTVVLLTGHGSPIGRDELSAHAIGPVEHIQLLVDDGPIARPAQVARFSAAGKHTGWPVHQSGHRITWACVHERIATGGGTLPYSLADLVHDVEFARSVMDD